MRLLDLCAGIGGFSLAATWLGWEIAGQVEIDPFCQRVLAKHWPDVPRHDDVFTMRGTDFGPVDVVTAGFPCQPYSLAGKRRGKEDDRAIWPEIARLTAEAQPAYALFENVPGLISLALDEVLADLEGIGYTAWPLVVPACAVDAPHRRDRLWILAHTERGEGGERCESDLLWRREEEAKQAGLGGGALAHTEGQPEREPGDDGEAERAERQPRLEPGRGGAGLAQPGAVADVAHTHRQRVPHHRPGEAHRAAGAVQGDGEERQRLRPDPGQRAHAGGHDWEAEPAVGRVADGIPRRVDRLRALGNAIVPQVAYEMLRALCCS